MKEEFHYKCPLESTCIAHKHCHVLKTAERLQSVIPAIVKCPAQKNKEIVVKIGTVAPCLCFLLAIHGHIDFAPA